MTLPDLHSALLISRRDYLQPNGPTHLRPRRPRRRTLLCGWPHDLLGWLRRGQLQAPERLDPVAMPEPLLSS